MDERLKAFLDDLREGLPAFEEVVGVGVNTVGGDGSPLHYAIVRDEFDIVRPLLESGAAPALTDDSSLRPV